MTWLLSLLLVMLIVSHSRLERRVAALEPQRDKEPPPVGPRHSSPRPPSPEPPRTPPEATVDSEPPSRPERETANTERPATRKDEDAQPPGMRALEIAMGTRWSVWAGALMLAIGAAFLVRYGIERGVFGPAVRVAAGISFGLILATAGELLRRRDDLMPRIPAGIPSIPALLTGVGGMAAFGSIYAAHALYGFVDAPAAFVLLAAAGLLTMGASLLHGQALAGVGLVGALATPVLVASQAPNPWTVVLYAPVVVATAHAFAWHRGWRALAVAASTGGLAWTYLLSLNQTSAMAGPVHGLIQMALSAWVLCFLPYKARDPAGDRGPADAIMALSAAAVVLTLGRAGTMDGFGPAWVLTGLLAAALPLSLSTTRTAFRGYAGLSALVALGVAAAWPKLHDLMQVAPWGAQRGTTYTLAMVLPWPELANPAWFALVAAAATAAIAGLALLPVLKGEDPSGHAAHGVAFAVAAAPPAMLALAWYRLTLGEPSIAMAACALACAALHVPVVRRLDGLVRLNQTGARLYLTGAVLTAMVACVGLGLAFALTGNALTAALALTAAGAARISVAYRFEPVRWTVLAIAALVAARIVLDPMLARYGLSATPILNGILVAYAIPAAAFAYAGATMGTSTRKDEQGEVLVQALALLLAVAGAALEIRHLTHGGVLGHGSVSLFEAGLYVTGAYAASIALVRLGRDANPVVRNGGFALGTLAHAGSLTVLGMILNPILTNDPVAGGFLLNDVTASFALNTLMALLLARSLVGRGREPELTGARVVALLMAFLTVNLYVRMAFNGAHLGFAGAYASSFGPRASARMATVSQDELYAYSAAWLALGLGFLAYGLRFASWPARVAGMALLVATVAKVFLVDMAGLDGFHRAAAFIGLGAALMLVGFVYQRFVYRTGKEVATG